MNKHIEPSVDFEYPNDETVKVDPNQINVEFVNKLINHILTRENPVAALTGLAIASGFDLSYIFNCENTITAIAEKLHMTKQRLSANVVEARHIFHLRVPHNRCKRISKNRQFNTFPRHMELIKMELNQMTDKDRAKALMYISSSLCN